jgi:hypothetical protein
MGSSVDPGFPKIMFMPNARSSLNVASLTVVMRVPPPDALLLWENHHFGTLQNPSKT